MAQSSGGPPSLPVGTEVSAKYRGAFCEAQVKTVQRVVKCKVVMKDCQTSVMVTDEEIKGIVKLGSVVEVKHPDTGQPVEAVINKLMDNSTYTVVFDDGDERTLRRTQLCLKGDKHFIESETLDNLPLSHPEHFGTPVLQNKKAKRKNDPDESEGGESGEEEESPRRAMYRGRHQELVGKLMLVDMPYRKGSAIPALVVLPDANSLNEVKNRDQILVRSFKDSKFTVVTRKDLKEFTRGVAIKNDDKTMRTAFEKALLYHDTRELPVGWKREDMLGSDVEDDLSGDEEDEYASEDEPFEEKDRFVAQLYKFMDDRGTPINKGPCIGNKDLNLYKLFKIVQNCGGYNKVTKEMKWPVVYSKMGLPSLHPNPAHQIKTAYKKYLDAYETFYRKLGSTMGTSSRPGRGRQNSSRSILNFRGREKSPRSPKPPVDKVKEDPNSAKAKDEGASSIDEEHDSASVASEESDQTVRRNTPRRDARSLAANKDDAKDKKDDGSGKRKEEKKEESVKVKKEDAGVRPKKDLSPGPKGKKEDAKSKKDEDSLKKDERKSNRKAKPDEEKEVEKEVKKTGRLARKDKEDDKKDLKTEKPAVEKESPKKRITRRKLLSIGQKKDAEPIEQIKEATEKKDLTEKKEAAEKKETVDKPTEKKEPPKKMSTREVKPVERRDKDIPRTLERRDSRAQEKKETPVKVPEKREIKLTEKKARLLSEERKMQRKEREKKKEAEKEEEVESEKSDIDGDSEGKSEPMLKKDFPIGSKLRVKYGRGKNQKIYLAKVVDTGKEGNHKTFLVHYAGWNTRYDEWIRADRVVSVIEKTDGEKPKLPVQKQTDGEKTKPSLQKQTEGEKIKPSVQKQAEGEKPKPVQKQFDGEKPKPVQKQIDGEKPKPVQKQTDGEKTKTPVQRQTGQIKQAGAVKPMGLKNRGALFRTPKLGSPKGRATRSSSTELLIPAKKPGKRLTRRGSAITDSSEEKSPEGTASSDMDDTASIGTVEEKLSTKGTEEDDDILDVEQDEEAPAVQKSAAREESEPSIPVSEVPKADKMKEENEAEGQIMADKTIEDSQECSSDSVKDEDQTNDSETLKSDLVLKESLAEVKQFTTVRVERASVTVSEVFEPVSEIKSVVDIVPEKKVEAICKKDKDMPTTEVPDISKEKEEESESSKSDIVENSESQNTQESCKETHVVKEPADAIIPEEAQPPVVTSDQSIPQLKRINLEEEKQSKDTEKLKSTKGRKKDALKEGKKSSRVSEANSISEIPTLEPILSPCLETSAPTVSKSGPSPYDFDEDADSTWQPEITKKWEPAQKAVSTLKDSPLPVKEEEGEEKEKKSEEKEKKKVKKKTKKKLSVPVESESKQDDNSSSPSTTVTVLPVSDMPSSQTISDIPKEKGVAPTKKKGRKKREATGETKIEATEKSENSGVDILQNTDSSVEERPLPKKRRTKRVSESERKDSPWTGQSVKKFTTKDTDNITASSKAEDIKKEVFPTIQPLEDIADGQSGSGSAPEVSDIQPTATLSGAEVATGRKKEVSLCESQGFEPQMEPDQETATPFDNTPPTTPEHEEGQASSCSYTPGEASSQGPSSKAVCSSSSSSSLLPSGQVAKCASESPSDNDVTSTASTDNLDSGVAAQQSESSGTDQDLPGAKKRKHVEESTSQVPKKRKRVHGTRSRTARKSPKYSMSDNMSYKNSDSQGSSSATPNHCPDSPATNLAKSPRPSKYNFNADLGEYLEGEERCSFLISKMKEIKSIYMNLKSEVASIDRRRKRARRKERESSQSLRCERENST